MHVHTHTNIHTHWHSLLLFRGDCSFLWRLTGISSSWPECLLIRPQCACSISLATSHCWRRTLPLGDSVWKSCPPPYNCPSEMSLVLWLIWPLCHLSLSKCNYVFAVKDKPSIRRAWLKIKNKLWLAAEEEMGDHIEICYLLYETERNVAERKKQTKRKQVKEEKRRKKEKKTIIT